MMIQAQHLFWAEVLFRPYVTGLMRRHFHALHLLGDVPSLSRSHPVLLLPNHSTWWDGFFIYLLNRELLMRPLYLMMLEEQLRKYRFFSKVGAYSIAPERPKSVLESLNYTVELLHKSTKPPPMVCWFPQGELLPWAHPLEYKQGLEWVLKRYQEPVNLLPLAIRCEFLSEQRPEVFFLFSESYRFNHSEFPGVEWLARRTSQLLDELGSQIANREEGQLLLRGRYSVNKIFDRLRGVT